MRRAGHELRRRDSANKQATVMGIPQDGAGSLGRWTGPIHASGPSWVLGSNCYSEAKFMNVKTLSRRIRAYVRPVRSSAELPSPRARRATSGSDRPWLRSRLTPLSTTDSTNGLASGTRYAARAVNSVRLAKPCASRREMMLKCPQRRHRKTPPSAGWPGGVNQCASWPEQSRQAPVMGGVASALPRCVASPRLGA
jgi:hypothetical protein